MFSALSVVNSHASVGKTAGREWEGPSHPLDRPLDRRRGRTVGENFKEFFFAYPGMLLIIKDRK